MGVGGEGGEGADVSFDGPRGRGLLGCVEIRCAVVTNFSL